MTSPIDPATLEQFTGGDKDIARDIYAQFLTATESDAHALREAVAAGNAGEISKAAHRVKGASRMIGASAVADLAEKIELAGRNGDLDAIHGAMPAFEIEHQLLLNFLRSETEA
jgi:two-component system sensor histidine kinase EvgS